MSVEADREDYRISMREAEEAIQAQDYETANRLLLRAHGLGHAVKAEHLRAHRGLIRVAFYSRRPLQMLSQSALLVLAFLFD
jgi:hypothetical protein